MFDIFKEELWITVMMGVFLGLGVGLRMTLGILYGNMIRETDNMAVTRNRLLRQCKLKFINCFQLNEGVNNVSVFVDKFMSRMSLGPFSFESLYQFSGQAEILYVVCCGIGICKGIAAGRMMGEIIPYYIACFVGLYLYFTVASAVDIKGKRHLLKINLVDYLENHLAARIGTTRRDLERLHYVRPGRKCVDLVQDERKVRELVLAEDEEPGSDISGQATKGSVRGQEETKEEAETSGPEDLPLDQELEMLLKEFLAI